MPSFEQINREQSAARPEQTKTPDAAAVFNRAQERIQAKAREVERLAETGALRLPPQFQEQIAQKKKMFSSRTMEALASLEAIRKKPDDIGYATTEEKDPWAYFDPEEIRKTSKQTKKPTART